MVERPPDALWNAEDLAAYLGYSEAAIRSMLSRNPERLPPRVQGLGLHR